MEARLPPDSKPTAETATVNARLEGFRDLDPASRLERVAAAAGLDSAAKRALQGEGALSVSLANGMIENVIGTFELPLGGRDELHHQRARLSCPDGGRGALGRRRGILQWRVSCGGCGGFTTSSSAPIMRAQVQVLGLSDPHGARARLLAQRAEIIAAANARDKVLIGLGGGCKDIEVHVFGDTAVGPMVVLHLLVDVRDAMGANTVNTMAETLAPMIEAITGGTVRLRILSNLADLRLARASVRLPVEALGTPEFSGERIAAGIVEACELAIVDPYRAATHNKGIMNGVDPIVVATGNDWRAVEAGAHAYACRTGRYTALSRWERDAAGNLAGMLEMPMPLGLVGGATRTHPAARAALALLGVKSATELSEIAVAVGLAQNMAALRALATEGIQRGHMALHARNIAILAGAAGTEIEAVATELAARHDVTVDGAKTALARLRDARG